MQGNGSISDPGAPLGHADRAAQEPLRLQHVRPKPRGELDPERSTDQALDKARQPRHQRAGDALGRVGFVPGALPVDVVKPVPGLKEGPRQQIARREAVAPEL